MNYSTPNSCKTQDLNQRMKWYRSANFVTSAAKFDQLPEDSGREFAIVGRSNAGKSTFLNILTGQRNLAKTSKTPGRTQLMNVFALALEGRRIIDLPGYGFAKVAQSQRFDWEKHLGEYLASRQSLSGVVMLMDIRHPLQELDLNMLAYLVRYQLPIYILLTKSDKLSKNAVYTTLMRVQKALSPMGLGQQVQTFSIQDNHSLLQVAEVLDEWLELNSASGLNQ